MDRNVIRDLNRDPGKTEIRSECDSASAGPVDVRTRSAWMNKWMSCMIVSPAVIGVFTWMARIGVFTDG